MRPLVAQLRFGRVAVVRTDDHSVDVQLLDIVDSDGQEGATIERLRVLVPVGGDHALPPKDTDVVCLIYPDRLANGVVLGTFYSEAKKPPLDDAGKRAMVSDDLRLGAFDAEDPAARAPKVNENFDDLKSHFDAMWGVINGGVINEPGNGGPSALQAALKGALAGSPYPQPLDVAAEKVKVK